MSKKITFELRLIIAHELMALILKILPAGSDAREDFAYMVYQYMKHRLASHPKKEEVGGE